MNFSSLVHHKGSPFLIYSHMYTGASKLGMADVLQLTGRREIVQITSEVFIIT